MSERVWAIVEGESSDYHVVGVFTSKTTAERMWAFLGRPDASIEEWPLNPGVDAVHQGLTRWYLTMSRDGTTEGCAPVMTGLPFDLDEPVHPWYRGPGLPDGVRGMVWAKDARHAITIFNEHRIQWIATNRL